MSRLFAEYLSEIRYTRAFERLFRILQKDKIGSAASVDKEDCSFTALNFFFRAAI
jgi:hypothetical protein